MTCSHVIVIANVVVDIASSRDFGNPVLAFAIVPGVSPLRVGTEQTRFARLEAVFYVWLGSARKGENRALIALVFPHYPSFAAITITDHKDRNEMPIIPIPIVFARSPRVMW